MAVALELSATVAITVVCLALGVERASFYRWCYQPLPEPRSAPPRTLSVPKRTAVLATLGAERFADQAPAEVYATLLDEGLYLCSIRTMYRILNEDKAVQERRAITRHGNYAKPELIATAPNQVWSWDITKLKAHPGFQGDRLRIGARRDSPLVADYPCISRKTTIRLRPSS